VTPLLGQLKREMSERYHMMILAQDMVSSLELGKWAYRMSKSLLKRGRKDRLPPSTGVDIGVGVRAYYLVIGCVVSRRLVNILVA
jgi:hypothetical protein